MVSNIRKYSIILFTLIFGFRVFTLFIADRLYSMSMAAEEATIHIDRGVNMLDAAMRLDSTNVDIYIQKYELLDIKLRRGDGGIKNQVLKEQLQLLRESINLYPTWPTYHMYYALTLKRIAPNPNILTQQAILSEMKKAVDLKPHSELYRKIYKRYLTGFKSTQ